MRYNSGSGGDFYSTCAAARPGRAGSANNHYDGTDTGQRLLDCLAGIADANSTIMLSNNGSTVGTTTADSSGHWSVPGIALSNGVDYSFAATATDTTNNTSSPSKALAFHDDQSAPAAPGSVAGERYSASRAAMASPTIRRSRSLVLRSGGTRSSTPSTAVPPGSTNAPTIAQLVQGSNTVDVRQTDVAGNVSGTTAFTFTLDSTAPSETFPTVTLTSDTGASNSDFITSNGGVQFAGAVADTGGAGIASVQVFNGATPLGTATVGAGTWSLNTTLASRHLQQSQGHGHRSGRQCHHDRQRADHHCR